MPPPRSLGLLIAAVFTLAACSAPIPVTEEPHHRVVFEHADFRIMEVNVPPGMMTEEHLHEHDVVSVSMSEGTETRVQASGEDWEARPPRPLGDASVTEYAGKPGAHRVENSGSGAYHLFAVENLRTEGWATDPAVTGPDTSLVGDARAFKVYDVRLGGNRFQVRHVHTSPTLLLMVGGRVISEGGEVKADAEGAEPALPSGLKQLEQPGQWVYLPAGEPHYVVRLAPDEARVVEIELR